MIKEELIAELQKLPKGIQICVCDYRKNLNDDMGEGSTAGIYPDFEIELLDKNSVRKGSKPFVALNIKNDDYNDDGTLADR